jgi:hypothetical protein
MKTADKMFLLKLTPDEGTFLIRISVWRFEQFAKGKTVVAGFDVTTDGDIVSLETDQRRAFFKSTIFKCTRYGR